MCKVDVEKLADWRCPTSADIRLSSITCTLRVTRPASAGAYSQWLFRYISHFSHFSRSPSESGLNGAHSSRRGRGVEQKYSNHACLQIILPLPSITYLTSYHQLTHLYRSAVINILFAMRLSMYATLAFVALAFTLLCAVILWLMLYIYYNTMPSSSPSLSPLYCLFRFYRYTAGLPSVDNTTLLVS